MSAKTIASLTHVQRVRLLYKTCLRLHRGLPTQMQILGDAYVKDEFRRHKEADPVQTATFMEAWAVSFEFFAIVFSPKYFSCVQIPLCNA